MNLSQKRAGAVVDVLITEHGIETSRLTPKGLGFLAPVDSTRRQDGKEIFFSTCPDLASFATLRLAPWNTDTTEVELFAPSVIPQGESSSSRFRISKFNGKFQIGKDYRGS